MPVAGAGDASIAVGTVVPQMCSKTWLASRCVERNTICRQQQLIGSTLLRPVTTSDPVRRSTVRKPVHSAPLLSGTAAPHSSRPPHRRCF